MANPNVRFKQVREHLKLTQKEMAKSLGTSSSQIADIESGRFEPSKNVIKTMLTIFGINANWILTGEGEMFARSNKGMMFTIKEYIPEKVLIEFGGGRWKFQEELPSLTTNEDIAILAIYDLRASAGQGLENDYQIEVIDHYPVLRKFIYPYRPSEIVGIEAKGDSMTPTIYNDDVIFYVNHLEEGDGIYVCRFDVKILVKRLQFNHDGTVLLISDNSRYKPQEVCADDTFEILGKVIGWIHRHRY